MWVTHHSALAWTASFLTSLFLSSRGLARARNTRARKGNTCVRPGETMNFGNIGILMRCEVSCRKQVGSSTSCTGNSETALMHCSDAILTLWRREPAKTQWRHAEKKWCVYENLCESDHCRAAGEGQQPADQSLQLLEEDLGWVDEDGLQAGQSGELDALVGTRQGLQQQRQELETHSGTSSHCRDRPRLCSFMFSAGNWPLGAPWPGPVWAACWWCWTRPSGSWASSLKGRQQLNRRWRRMRECCELQQRLL